MTRTVVESGVEHAPAEAAADVTPLTSSMNKPASSSRPLCQQNGKVHKELGGPDQSIPDRGTMQP